MGVAHLFLSILQLHPGFFKRPVDVLTDPEGVEETLERTGRLRQPGLDGPLELPVPERESVQDEDDRDQSCE